MAEPWEDDPDNLVEITFVQAAGVADRAAAVVAAAMQEIDTGYPRNSKVDAKRRRRAEIVHRSFPDPSAIVSATAEFLTGAGRGEPALDVRKAQFAAQELARQVASLQHSLGALGASLTLSNRTEAGDEIVGGAIIASSAASEAYRSLVIASEALAAVQCHVPIAARGRGGALSRLRLAPDIVLLSKLETLWKAAGLDVGGGEDGHGLDVFMRHALSADSPSRISGKNWLSKLRAALRDRSLSEITPHK